MNNSGHIIIRLIKFQHLSRRQVQLLETKEWIETFPHDGEIGHDYIPVLIDCFPEKLSDKTIQNIASAYYIADLYRVKAVASKLSDEQINIMVNGEYDFHTVIDRKEVNRLTEDTIHRLINLLVSDHYMNILRKLYKQVDDTVKGLIMMKVRRNWSGGDVYNFESWVRNIGEDNEGQ